MKTLLSIQYLRAAAALAVVVYHALQWLPPGGFDVGRAGVDVFFVISGFIMWSITAGAPGRPGAFLWRRFTRVAPAYWAITLVTAAACALWPAFLPQVRVTPSHLALSLAFIQHRDPLGLPFPLLPPGWTLNYEALFYLVFAACLFLPERRRLKAVLIALAVIAVVGTFLAQGLYEFGANPMLLQFAAGVMVARAAQMKTLPGAIAGGLMIIAGVAILALMQLSGFISELWRPFLWGAPALLIVLGAVTLEARIGVFASRTLKALGDSSYAIYLVHMPVTALIAHTLGHDNAWTLVPAAVTASALAGLAWRAWLEKPLIEVLRGLAKRRPALSAA
jgi:exopolysaccharide production protein ExoZ